MCIKKRCEKHDLAWSSRTRMVIRGLDPRSSLARVHWTAVEDATRLQLWFPLKPCRLNPVRVLREITRRLVNKILLLII